MPSPQKKECIVVAIILLLLTVQLLGAQEAPVEQMTVFTLGQQTIALNAGPIIPLFYQRFDGEVIGQTNLSLGGIASLQWSAHLDNHWMLGIEIGGMFSRSVRENTLYMLPFTIRGAYILHLHPFMFPIYLGAGMNISRYEGQSHINLILKPGFSALWSVTTSWAFGLNFVYWWIPQPWREDPDKGRMANFLEITVSAQYTF